MYLKAIRIFVRCVSALSKFGTFKNVFKEHSIESVHVCKSYKKLDLFQDFLFVFIMLHRTEVLRQLYDEHVTVGVTASFSVGVSGGVSVDGYFNGKPLESRYFVSLETENGHMVPRCSHGFEIINPTLSDSGGIFTCDIKRDDKIIESSKAILTVTEQPIVCE